MEAGAAGAAVATAEGRFATTGEAVPGLSATNLLAPEFTRPVPAEITPPSAPESPTPPLVFPAVFPLLVFVLPSETAPPAADAEVDEEEEPLGFTFLCCAFFGDGVSVALRFVPALFGRGGLPNH